MDGRSESVLKKYKLVAPDGGWGYMICIAATMVFSITTGFGACFGLLYHDLIVKLKIGSTMITVASGLGVLVNALFGFLTSALLKKLSFRQLAFIAATMFNIGVIGLYLFQSIASFFICYTFLQSAGFGLLLNLTSTILNDYFTTKRLFTVSLTQTAVGITCMAIPKLVEKISEIYGSRECLLIISGISTHLFLAVALMQPVQWHVKKIRLPDDEVIDENLTLLANPTNESDNVPVVKVTEIKSPEVQVIEKTDIEVPLPDKKQSAIKILVSELFDKDIIKIVYSSIIIVGPSFAFFCDLTFSMIFPQALYSLQWNYENVATAISIVAFGDTAARGVFILLNNWLYKMGIEKLFIIGLGIACIARIGMLLSKDITPVLIFMTFIGVSRCFFVILGPLVIVDAVGVEKFTAANGTFMMVVGIISIVLGPLTGAVRDITGSYTVVFSIMAGIILLVMVIWIIELYYKERKYRRSQRKASTNP
ncbi:monocarboxylate transporter 7-like [Achroia grisella]|uniref:monocarboxylate transporter 7-like n=1 Tax=Achroia grisella TaxID=688607 RepID=UPI0027D34AE6|nr:monocarboxylate transporter 7-like [Achroia grisella]